MILVDISVWKKFLSGKLPVALHEIVRPEEISTCPPVYLALMKLGSGSEIEKEIKSALKNMNQLEDPMDQEFLDQSLELHTSLSGDQWKKDQGLFRAMVAMAAIRNKQILLHCDAYYDHIPARTGLVAFNLDK